MSQELQLTADQFLSHLRTYIESDPFDLGYICSPWQGFTAGLLSLEDFLILFRAYIASEHPTEEDINRFNRADVERWIQNATGAEAQ